MEASRSTGDAEDWRPSPFFSKGTLDVSGSFVPNGQERKAEIRFRDRPSVPDLHVSMFPPRTSRPLVTANSSTIGLWKSGRRRVQNYASAVRLCGSSFLFL